MSTEENTQPEDRMSLVERRQRRQHRRMSRKRAQENADTRFYGAVFSISAIAAAVAIGLGVMAMGEGPTSTNLGALTKPWLGPASRLEVFGILVIVLLAGVFLFRTRKRK